MNSSRLNLMAPSKVFVFKLNIGENSSLDVSEARSFLSVDECARADRFKFDIHRFRFVRGRGYLRRTIGELIDVAPEEIVFSYGKNGKPEVEGSNLVFNLSHSGDLGLLAYSFDVDKLGVDVELVTRGLDYAALCEHYFTTEEQQWVLAPFLGPEDQKRRFFEVWTAKEARMKLFGEGLHLDPRAIHLQLNASKPIGFSAPIPTALALESVAIEGESAIAAITATSDFESVWASLKN